MQLKGNTVIFYLKITFIKFENSILVYNLLTLQFQCYIKCKTFNLVKDSQCFRVMVDLNN